MWVEKRSVRSPSSARREKTQESIVLSVDVSVKFSPEDYTRGQTKKGRMRTLPVLPRVPIKFRSLLGLSTDFRS